MTRPRTSKNSSSSIAEEHFPGWKAINVSSLEEMANPSSADAADTPSKNVADAVMPSQEELRSKYLGARYAPNGAPDEMTSAMQGASNADTDLVELESGPLKKTVAVSKSTKKVLWSQG